ncbi:LANO_0H03928g1_1 [Lachancea nothofagi CBS 11611]|uniref:COP9 signalosome complex subunit 5 n=1 Tax=Lachancea nothofagi CBS 11611 TaxID=1266666 RepID=A0A1G4KLI3_9SACH|nr:LANO_0H03928g1_1 [Lachancea nothofagi CBS 11611]
MHYKDETCKALRANIEQYSSLVKDMEQSNQFCTLPQGMECQIEQHQLLSDYLNHRTNREPLQGDLWRSDPRYFKRVSLSNRATYKILQHAVKGGDIEIMGMLVGKVQKGNIVVFDCYALPVEGTETRVNAQLESYEYMVQYMSEVYDSIPGDYHIVGWYHSHPGYGCWLSGIDVQTQELNQTFQDPYVAIVVDPRESIRDKRLCIGAFRTISGENSEEFMQANGSTNTEKYGHHSSKYYELDLDVFTSTFDRTLEKLQLRLDRPLFDSMEDDILVERLLESIQHWQNYQRLPASSQVILNAPIRSVFTAEDNETDMRVSSFSNSLQSSDSSSVTSSADIAEGSDVDMASNILKRDFSTQSSLLQNSSDHPPVISGQPSQETTLELEFQLHKRRLNLSKLREYQHLRYYRDAFTL